MGKVEGEMLNGYQVNVSQAKDSFFQSPISHLRSCCLLLVALCFLLLPAQAQARINLNTASAAELMRLPHIGQTVARRILEHRSKHGPFKRPSDLIVIKGLSAKRYREIAHLIRI